MSAPAAPARRWLVFNGDADGLCAAHQLRLAGFAPDEVVTGVKRDIALLSRVQARPGDEVRVADIAVEANRADLDRLLAQRVHVEWFDHHFPGAIPDSPRMHAHVDTASDTCSSLIVDAHLGGRYRAWAIAAAFGDNLHGVARALADAAGLGAGQVAALRELGELLNYNAYGEDIADLHVAPAEVFTRMAGFGSPFGFVREVDVLERIRSGFAADMRRALAIAPLRAGRGHAIFRLPAEPWARRVNGVFANELAREHPDRAHAVLVAAEGGDVVSVRAPLSRPVGADRLCRAFAGGGGRARAAGINLLPHSGFERFCAALEAEFGP